MIDHVSIAVRDLDAATRFYEPVLAALGSRKLVVREATVGFGKRYAEFWLNARAAAAPSDGAHVALRARSREMVEAFHAAGLAAGGTSDGAPGLRADETDGYYAAYIRDPDGNRIEAVTFIAP